MISSVGIVLHDFSLGGTERIAARLGRAWASIGVAVTFYCGVDDGPMRKLIGPQARVVPLDPPIPRGKGSMQRLAAAAEKAIARERVDAVFVPGNYHWPVAHRLSRLPIDQRPVIAAQISAALRKQQRGPVKEFFYDLRMRRLLRDADGLVALSDVAADQARAIVGEGPVVRTIATPALDDDVAPPIDAGGMMIVAAGRLVPEKGFGTLIEAFSLLPDPTLQLTIVGAGPDEERLRGLARSLGIADRVDLPGYQPDIRPWLDRGRLFVLSSDYEGYPAVLIEALAAGRPVIATDCTPATDALLGSRTFGEVVPVGDAAEMAGAMYEMLASPPPVPQPLAEAVTPHRLGEVALAYLDFFEALRLQRRG
ncbi:glycosyltransferase [Sphingomonas sp. AP4-R1]|uniref:glycosyltransferase n=1 Tax=Sphingomonas sp. AP4-R1 TaxID=2735134 RepID=UPI001493461F|nr:glycosyltransferase [Sphingomonas sp. AP4-R1]QJU60342.1 glycosyltransferase [Sphingomonas sp. AP4-R1]